MAPEFEVPDQATPQPELPVGAEVLTHPVDVRDVGNAALIKEQRFGLAEEWLSTRIAHSSEEPKPVPADIASEVSILAQTQIKELIEDEDVVLDGSFNELEAIRDEAIEAADTLDFRLVELSGNDWALRVQLNAMRHKFRDVSPDALANFLGSMGARYEYRALHIRDIISDHAPALLTDNLKVLLDPSQPLWRVCSAQASILLKGKPATSVKAMHVDQIPTALPTGNRVEYQPEDDDRSMKPISEMSDEELSLYCRPERISDIQERGYALYGELTLATQESLLARKLFEVIGKSHSQDSKELAGERNRELENEPILQEGDLVHATRSPEIVEAMLSSGLRCGEAVVGNSRSVIAQPFTVSFLEVTREIAGHESVAERLDLLRNTAYGGINIVLHRDTGYMEGQKGGAPNQRQIFGGVPSTKVKSIVIREGMSTAEDVQKVIQAIVKNGMFIPVYNGTTGESLLTSEQFDQLSTAA